MWVCTVYLIGVWIKVVMHLLSLLIVHFKAHMWVICHFISDYKICKIYVLFVF